MITIDWRKIRTHKTSQNNAFEELVCQLAYTERIDKKDTFIRVEAPDGGVEAYRILKGGEEIGWQAKYFINNLLESQWMQIEKSFKIALEKHPQLTEYYICLPLDFADPRIPGKKSAKDKWDEHTSKWVAYAKSKGRSIKFHFWGSFQLTERLSNTENAGRRYYWFNEAEFSNDWFKEKLDEAIAYLGSRYTPKFNFELNVAKSFNGIYRSKDYKNDIESLFHNLLIKAGDVILSAKEEFKEQGQILLEKITELQEQFSKINYDEIKDLDISAWSKTLVLIINTCDDLTAKMNEMDESDKKTKLENGLIKKDDIYSRYYVHLFGYEKEKVRKLDMSVDNLYEYINGPSTQGFNNPFILLKGEKGIGKSHLLADIASQKQKILNPSILLLGQHFNKDDPWVQILSKLGVRGNKEEFLGALDAGAQSFQCRIPVIIDAINEGAGIRLWHDYITGFVQTIKKYKWLGLILSVRTPYEEKIFEENFVSENLLEIIHYGFDENEYEASKFFFQEYGIEQPKIPLLYPEFRQPLFLKLFCEGLQKANKTSIPKEGYEGITEIMDFLIKAINKSLSKPNRLDYSSSLQIVNISLALFINQLIENKTTSLDYQEAHILLENGLSKYNLKPGILEELIAEGLLAKTLYRQNNEYKEGVYFTYQRYEDHFRAKYFLEKYFDRNHPNKAFTKSGGIGKYFKDNHIAYHHAGLLEALAIQIPEHTGREIFEVFPHIKNYGFFIHAVIDSLIWRKNETVKEKIFDYIKSYLSEDLYKYFINTILLISGKPGHYFNGNFIHRWLMPITMADRDQHWTTYINQHYNYTYSVKRLIDWCWSGDDKSKIEDEPILLVATSVAWFLTASNRNLRDSATKALVSLLRNRLGSCLSLLKKFKDVNDIGVYERLFAVAYAVATISKKERGLKELCEYINDEVFGKENVIPHLLLRDYARNIIEFGIYKKQKLNIDITKIRPPYKSEWYRHIPTNIEIKNLEYNYKAKNFKKNYWGQNAIIDSVKGHIGDFGNYVAQGIYNNWKIKVEEVRNLIIKRAIELGYDVEKHGHNDRDNSEFQKHNQRIERIGKKYQWQAFYEIAAKVSDHKAYTSHYGTKYNGPWKPYLRDIDPTLLITKTQKERYKNHSLNWWFNVNYNNWAVDNKKWIHQKTDLPNINSLLHVKDESNEDWLVLDTDIYWESPVPIGVDKYKTPGKDVRYSIAAYLIPEKQKKTLLEYLSNEGKSSLNLDHRHPVHELLSKEYYWSPAYNDLYATPYENGFTVTHEKTGKEIGNCFYTSNYFLWEEEFDYSKEKAISFLKPSKILFDGLCLEYSEREGEYINKEGEIICFDPSVNNSSNSCLLIRKKELASFLKEKKMSLIWILSGEKRLLDHHHSREKYWGRTSFRGLYSLANNNLSGWITSKIEERN